MNKETDRKIKQQLCRHKKAGVNPLTGELSCPACEKRLNSKELKESLIREYGTELGDAQFKLVVLQELEVRAKLNYEEERNKIKRLKDLLFKRNGGY